MALKIPDIDEIAEKLANQALHLKTMIQYREPEKRLVLFYAMGYFADTYLQLAEQAMKQGSEYEPTQYSAKAGIVRNVCSEVFGSVPEKDYYTGLFKEIKGVYTGQPHEVLQQVATYAAQSTQVPPEYSQNPKMLDDAIKKELKTFKLTGLEGKYGHVLKQYREKFKESPSKLVNVLELIMLYRNVNEIIKMVMQKQDELSGFKVSEEGE